MFRVHTQQGLGVEREFRVGRSQNQVRPTVAPVLPKLASEGLEVEIQAEAFVLA